MLQERTQTLERELSATAAQLQQLQRMQKAMHARNQLLEKLLQLHKQEGTTPNVALPQPVAVSGSNHRITF